MFRAGLLLIIRRIISVVLIGCWQPVNTTHDYTTCCLYRADPPDDEQQACSKHVEVFLLK